MAGTFSFEYLAGYDCHGRDSVLISQQFSPEAAEDEFFQICEDETIELIANGSGVVLWDDSSQSISKVVDKAGIYLVEFHNECGMDVQFFEVNIKKCGVDKIANIFSPNGDNVNDLFTYDQEGAEVVSAMIWDRWGNVVHGGNLTNSWDGTFGNQACENGVYTYIIKYNVSTRDDPVFLVGDITISN